MLDYPYRIAKKRIDIVKADDIAVMEPDKPQKKVSEKDAFFFCYAARLLSIFIFKTSLVFSIISFGKVILQK